MFKSYQQGFDRLESWEKLKEQLLPQISPAYTNSYEKISFYDLVSVLVDENEKPVAQKYHPNDVESFIIFTRADVVQRMCRSYNQTEILKSEFEITNHCEVKTKVYMLGDLIECLSNNSNVQSIKVNPVMWKEDNQEFPFILCEEVLFAPILDTVTKKYMMTDPENAIALLAIDPSDQERFGIEIIFHAITKDDLPEDSDKRSEEMRKEIERLSFYAPRVPSRKGSGNFYCTLLNLESPSEEMAFIRNYPTFENFIDPVFVTSNLELLCGDLNSISYDGEKIDTIFTPLINWQKNKNKALRSL